MPDCPIPLKMSKRAKGFAEQTEDAAPDAPLGDGGEEVIVRAQPEAEVSVK
jgi:hypothetical protein